MRGQGRLQALGVAAEHARHLGKAETERAQCCDLGGARHLACAISPPSGRGASRGDKAALLVEPQCLGRNAEPAGGFGWAEESGRGVYESPRCSLAAPFIGAVPGDGATAIFALGPLWLYRAVEIRSIVMKQPAVP